MNTLSTFGHWLDTLSNNQITLLTFGIWLVVGALVSIGIAAKKRQLVVERALSIRAVLSAGRRGLIGAGVAIVATLFMTFFLSGIAGDCPHGGSYDCTPDPWSLDFAMGATGVSALAIVVLVLIPVLGALAVLLGVVGKILLFFLRPIARGISYSYRVLRPRIPVKW